jgi:hypothetical protein
MSLTFITLSQIFSTSETSQQDANDLMLEALDSAGHLHDEPAPAVRFSYSRKEHGVLQRLAIHAIERLTGQPRLERLYCGWAENPHPHENIFSAGLRLLNLRLDMDEAPLAKIPRSAPCCSWPTIPSAWSMAWPWAILPRAPAPIR